MANTPIPMPPHSPSCLMTSLLGDLLASWGLHLMTLLYAPANTSQRQLRKLCHMPSCKGWCCPSSHPCTPHQVCCVLPHCPHQVTGVCYHLGGLCVLHTLALASLAPAIGSNNGSSQMKGQIHGRVSFSAFMFLSSNWEGSQINLLVPDDSRPLRVTFPSCCS